MKSCIYLAKEPDAGVRNDLSHLSGEVTIVDCLNSYGDYYRKIGYNVISKDEFFDSNDMRFDVYVGNPPYQDSDNAAKNNKLWHKFVLQSLSMCKPGGHIKLVTPSSIIGETGFGKKMLKILSNQYNMVSIDYTAKRHFPTVGVDICCWHVINESYNGETKVTNKDGVSYHNLKEGMPLTGDALVIHSILNKIAKSNHSRIPLQMGQDIAKEDYVEDGKFAVYASGQVVKYTNIIPNTPNCLKFVVPFSSSYKSRFTTTGHIGMLNVWCSIRSEDEGDHLKSIIDHPLMQFYIERYKKTSGFTPAVKNAMIPMLESTENIHQQFDLSPEEVQYLRNNNYA
jgi:hypothetical protein